MHKPLHRLAPRHLPKVTGVTDLAVSTAIAAARLQHPLRPAVALVGLGFPFVVALYVGRRHLVHRITTHKAVAP